MRKTKAWEMDGVKGYNRGLAIDEPNKPKSWSFKEKPFRTDGPTVEFFDGSRKDWYVELGNEWDHKNNE